MIRITAFGGLSIISEEERMDFAANSKSMLTAAGQQHWRTAPLSAVIQHIVSVHHEYLKVELPRIQRQLDLVYAANQRGSAMLAPLPGIFFLMKDDLDLHMHKEECTLFPAITRAERAAQAGRVGLPAGELALSICAMLAEHEGAVASLDDIRDITRNYALPPHACDLHRNLFVALEALERDIRSHIHLENEVLFQRATAL
jgi:regulator of cell morphogenesis and NO signaling